MDPDPEPRAPTLARRFDELVQELIPKIRLLEPGLTEEEVLEAARRMAIYRLDDDGGLDPTMKYPA
jgi:hypothetical protein